MVVMLGWFICVMWVTWYGWWYSHKWIVHLRIRELPVLCRILTTCTWICINKNLHAQLAYLPLEICVVALDCLECWEREEYYIIHFHYENRKTFNLRNITRVQCDVTRNALRTIIQFLFRCGLLRFLLPLTQVGGGAFWCFRCCFCRKDAIWHTTTVSHT